MNIHNLINFYTEQRCRIRVFIVNNPKGIVKDDRGLLCSFETDFYEPFQQKREQKKIQDVNAQQVLDTGVI